MTIKFSLNGRMSEVENGQTLTIELPFHLTGENGEPLVTLTTSITFMNQDGVMVSDGPNPIRAAINTEK